MHLPRHREPVSTFSVSEIVNRWTALILFQRHELNDVLYRLTSVWSIRGRRTAVVYARRSDINLTKNEKKHYLKLIPVDDMAFFFFRFAPSNGKTTVWCEQYSRQSLMNSRGKSHSDKVGERENTRWPKRMRLCPFSLNELPLLQDEFNSRLFCFI